MAGPLEKEKETEKDKDKAAGIMNLSNDDDDDDDDNNHLPPTASLPPPPPPPPPTTTGKLPAGSVRNARGNHSEQLDELRRVLPDPPRGMELTARAQILEHTMQVIERLMQRATFLAVELAVASPEATKRWVRTCSGGGQRPFIHTIGSAMKLFSMRKDWRYAEWWTLDERKVIRHDDMTVNTSTNDIQLDTTAVLESQTKSRPSKRARTQSYSGGMHNSGGLSDDVDVDSDTGGDGQSGVMDCPGNIHGCVVRDSESVMRLAWTLIHRGNENYNSNNIVSTTTCNSVMNSKDLNSSEYTNQNNTSNDKRPKGSSPSTTNTDHKRSDVKNNKIQPTHTVNESSGNDAQQSYSNDNGAEALDHSNEPEQRKERDMAEFARKSQHFEFEPRVGMPGRAWTSRRAEWLTNLKDSDVFTRSPLAKEFGMETCLAVPILFGGHVHSVMAFFSQQVRSFDQDTYELACHLASCVEEVYSPNRPGPWITNADALFPNCSMK